MISIHRRNIPPHLLKYFRPKYTVEPKSELLIPHRFALAMIEDGWILRNDNIWHKKNPMPSSVEDRFTSAHEHVFMFTKRPRYWADMYAVREAFADERMGNPGKYKNTVIPDRAKGDGGALNRGNGWEHGAARGGRNARDVWSLSSEPFTGAHFAVMPSKLVEKCLLVACPETVCAVCGAPWTRVVERETDRVNLAEGARQALRSAGAQTGGTQAVTLGVTQFVQRTDHGFQPTCPCDQGTVRGVVCDPFMGSGTIARTAIRLRRDYVGFDLNPEYVNMALNSLDNIQVVLL